MHKVRLHKPQDSGCNSGAEQLIHETKLQFPRLETFPVLDVWIYLSAQIASLQSVYGNRNNWLSVFAQC